MPPTSHSLDDPFVRSNTNSLITSIESTEEGLLNSIQTFSPVLASDGLAHHREGDHGLDGEVGLGKRFRRNS
jgi:hypothetical protein